MCLGYDEYEDDSLQSTFIPGMASFPPRDIVLATLRGEFKVDKVASEDEESSLTSLTSWPLAALVPIFLPNGVLALRDGMSGQQEYERRCIRLPCLFEHNMQEATEVVGREQGAGQKRNRNHALCQHKMQSRRQRS